MGKNSGRADAMAGRELCFGRGMGKPVATKMKRNRRLIHRILTEWDIEREKEIVILQKAQPAKEPIPRCGHGC